jgi:hypothetical protein
VAATAAKAISVFFIDKLQMGPPQAHAAPPSAHVKKKAPKPQPRQEVNIS